MNDAPSSPPALAVRDVSYAYGPKPALDKVAFSVLPGRVTMLLGPNGAGKTTLFALIARLFTPASGTIEIDGRNLATAGAAALAPMGIVFQQPTLDMDLSVHQNLRYFASLRGLSGTEANARIEDELSRLEMAERAGETVRALNGGHRRRVEIARALLHGPRILLLDEPTVGLDIPTRKLLIERLHSRAAEANIAILWATHLIDEVEDHDDLVVLHRGAVVAHGTTREVVAATGAEDLDAAFARLTGRVEAAP